MTRFSKNNIQFDSGATVDRFLFSATLFLNAYISD